MQDRSTILIYKAEQVIAHRALLFKPNDSPADKDLKVWNAFRAGSREALDYIFKEHASNLFAYGSKFTKDRHMVLDCIQDLFVELWNRRQRLSETNSIKYYLLKAMRRRTARAILGVRRFKAFAHNISYLEEKMNFSSEHFTIDQETEQSRKASLKRAIEGLTRRQRESIYLKFFQGLNNPEIASVMGLSKSSVNTLVSQAIRALRESLPKKTEKIR